MNKVIIIGSNGRMGQEILQELKSLNLDIEIFEIDKDDTFPPQKMDLIIDFSSVNGVLKHIEIAKKSKTAFCF